MNALRVAVPLLGTLLFVSPAYGKSFCNPGPDDRPETTLQGGLTQAELTVPGGFQGQWCGMRQVGHNPLLAETGLPRGSFGDVQLIGLCAYASMRDPSDLTLATTGTSVIDMRVPSNPVWTQTLRTPAMIRAYSALEIQGNLMVGAFKDFGPNNTNPLDVYDVSGNCLEPTLLSSFSVASGNHDGWLTPDGKTYYGVPFGGQTIQQNSNRIDIHVTDLSDPRAPKHLLNWNRLQLPPEVQARTLATRNFHDASTNNDGTRLYLALYGGNNALGGFPADGSGRCANGLLVLDSSDVAFRRPNPQLRYVSFLSWCDQKEDPTFHHFDPDFDDGSTAAAHATEYVIHENGKEYIVTTDESIAGLNGTWDQICRQRTFGRLIDISDETRPRVVSTFKPDVNDADNCAQVMTEQINGGMIHYIGFDDRKKMRLVFYAGANQGIRVVDYRDPKHPKEIAYYKAPSVATTDPGENDFTRPDPRYDPDNCFIYTGWNQGGLRILELTDPAYNPCMRREVKGNGSLDTPNPGKGKGHHKVRFDFEAKRTHRGLKGDLDLLDRGANAWIRIKAMSFLGSVRDQCGAIEPSANSVQLEGTGTFNGKQATFRVCAQDKAKGKKFGADLFHLVCTAGCAYSVGGEVEDGRIEVRQPKPDRPHGHNHHDDRD